MLSIEESVSDSCKLRLDANFDNGMNPEANIDAEMTLANNSAAARSKVMRGQEL